VIWTPSVLVLLAPVEQRCQAVLKVINDGATVTEMARRSGEGASDDARVVALLRYGGLGGLVEVSRLPGDLAIELMREEGPFTS
jgi:hypothetical protein